MEKILFIGGIADHKVLEIEFFYPIYRIPLISRVEFHTFYYDSSPPNKYEGITYHEYRLDRVGINSGYLQYYVLNTLSPEAALARVFNYYANSTQT